MPVPSSLPTGTGSAARGAASIRDVARLAGVSRQTVSRVINNHPSLRPETRDRVLQVIDEVRYRPNPIARALGQSRSRSIGVVMSSRAFYGPNAAVEGIEQAAQELGYQVTVSNVASGSEAAVREALELQADHLVSALVVLAPQARLRQAIEDLALDVPYVFLHSPPDGSPGSLSVDQVAGARAATRHLINLGHMNIRHVAGPVEWYEAEARLEGFSTEMINAGLEPGAVVRGDWSASSGYQAGLTLLEESGPCTAVYAANDQMALGVLHAFAEEGRFAPDTVSVVGFDDIPEAEHFWPPLTTVRQDFVELGRRCVQHLVGVGADDEGPLAPLLVVRSSTAPPRR